MSKTILLHHLFEEAAMDFLDGRQLTAARALAGLTVIELAQDAGVAARTIHRLEIGGVIQIAEKKRHGHVSRDVMGKIVEALARQGVELLSEGGGYGSGVVGSYPGQCDERWTSHEGWRQPD